MDEDFSDDEMEISLDDLAYLRQVERRSYLMKRSSKHPEIWLKRYCVLTDKLWVINVRSAKPRAIVLDIDNPAKVVKVKPHSSGSMGSESTDKNGEKRLKVFEISIESGLGQRTYEFRASSAKEQEAWYDDLVARSISTSENSIIHMADLIMSEESKMRGQRLQHSLNSILESTKSKKIFDSVHEDVLIQSCGNLVKGESKVSHKYYMDVGDESSDISTDEEYKREEDEEVNAVNGTHHRRSRDANDTAIDSKSTESLGYREVPSHNQEDNEGSAHLSSRASKPSDDGRLVRHEVGTHRDGRDGGKSRGHASRRHLRTGNVNVYDQILHRHHNHNISEPLHVVLSLAHDANRFKESLRHDSKVGMEQQWGRAVQVYLKYLVPRMVVAEDGGKVRPGVGVVERQDEASLSVGASASCFGLSDQCVSEINSIIFGSVEICSQIDKERKNWHTSYSSGLDRAKPSSGVRGVSRGEGTGGGHGHSFWGSVFGSSAGGSGGSALEPSDLEEGYEETTRQGCFMVLIDWTPLSTTPGGSGISNGGEEGGGPLSYWAYLSSRHDLMVNKEGQLLLYGKLKEGCSQPPGALFSSVLCEIEAYMNEP